RIQGQVKPAKFQTDPGFITGAGGSRLAFRHALQPCMVRRPASERGPPARGATGRMRTPAFAFALAFCFAAACGSLAHAQEWPVRPVTLVVPYAAGGPNDSQARILAARLGELLHQQVIIENVGGAGGMTGANRVAKAAPDGYTMLLGGLAVL